MLSSMLLALLQTNKGNILAKRTNVHIEPLKHSRSQDNFLKCVKENDQKKKGDKEKASWAQRKHFPAPQWEARFDRISGKEPGLLGPVSHYLIPMALQV